MLKGIHRDICGYTHYVFKNLDDNSYVMTTRWPNWQHRILHLGEIGYLTYKEVREGVDTWYDGQKFIPYNYSNIIFIRFILPKDDSEKDIIL